MLIEEIKNEENEGSYQGEVGPIEEIKDQSRALYRTLSLTTRRSLDLAIYVT